MSAPILEMRDIYKVYPNGVIANQQVNFSLQSGEIHALLGENGAGKSTLMKVLFGIESHQGGQIIHRGEPITIKSPHQAIARGIGMVHQHFMLVPSLTVAENLVLGMEPRKRYFFLDKEKSIREAAEIAEKYGFDIDVRKKIAQLPVGTRQQVEILKALYRGAKILILDEPTAVLTPQETSTLFLQLKTLSSQGHTVVFISHKLDEIKAVCHRLTIMRNGRSCGCYQVDQLTTHEISRLMMGREVAHHCNSEPAHLGEVLLEVDQLSVYSEQGVKQIRELSLQLRAGEILGIAGVEGNGQNELVEALTLLNSDYQGVIRYFGKEVRKLGIKGLRNLGVAHIPADRMTYGCAINMDITHNLLANQYDHPEFSRCALLQPEKMLQRAKKLIQDYQIKCQSPQQRVGMLSGGNIQKVVVARELSNHPKVIIANQPTRGIDVGAAEFIRRKLLQLREEGCTVLLVSADLNELMALSDRIAVMYKGKFSGIFHQVSQLNEEELGLYMLGVKKDGDG